MPKIIDLMTSTSSGTIITIEELQHCINRYKSERYNHIKVHITDDSRGAWISRNKLQEFLTNNPNCTGVRLYYGVIQDVNVGFEQGTHNLIFVPTEKSGQDNVDKLSDADWVVVLVNPTEQGISDDPGGAICPPPTNPCGGNRLNY